MKKKARKKSRGDGEMANKGTKWHLEKLKRKKKIQNRKMRVMKQKARKKNRRDGEMANKGKKNGILKNLKRKKKYRTEK